MRFHFTVRHCRLAAALLAASLFVAGPGRAASVDCTHGHCGLLIDGAYPHLVIGRLAHVGTDADTQRVYRWAKAHSYWQSLPNSPAPYLHDVKLVTIALPRALAERPVTVFMQVEEYADAPLVVGDLVRYSPHTAAHEPPPKADADELALYHGLTGCVATLCAHDDAACLKRYRQGVFTKAQGTPVNPQTGALITGGVSIDPVSLLPRLAHGMARNLQDVRKEQ